MNTPRSIRQFVLVLPLLGMLAFYVRYQSGNAPETAGPAESVSVDSLRYNAPDQKQRGIHFFGRRDIDPDQLQQLKKAHIEWLTFVPYGWQADYNSAAVGRRGEDYSSWSRRDSAFARQIQWVKEEGFLVMMKPHIWMGDNESGKWRSEIEPEGGEAGWQKWAASYQDFILHYAKMSEALGIEMFCIGTELHQPIKGHPEFWKQLIGEVRKVFSGQLTYAANWYKEVDDVSFWAELDYIGVQAYYPLCKQVDPPLSALLKGWRPHLAQLEKLHKKYNKPILFTEIGYKSTPDAAIEPWEWVDRIQPKYRVQSLENQANCYEAFFRTFWHQEWFAGAHFWQWQSGGRRWDREWQNFDFTPQNKPAEQTLSKWFARR